VAEEPNSFHGRWCYENWCRKIFEACSDFSNEKILSNGELKMLMAEETDVGNLIFVGLRNLSVWMMG
jgi:hypothetical protein